MEQTITVYGIVLHPKTSQILLVPSAEGWILPHFIRERWETWSGVSDVNDTFCRLLGFRSTTLRCHAIESKNGNAQLIYGLENIGSSWTPSTGCLWASYDDIRAKSLIPNFLIDHIASWFTWEISPEIRRVPWYQRGWAKPAIAWIEQQMKRLGMRMAGSPRQLRTSQRSTVWEIPIIDDSLFFKAIPPFLQHEIALTEYLAKLFPDAIPHILAKESSQGWMLMASAGEATLEYSMNLDDWCTALNRYSEIQVESSRQVNTLAAIGCPVMPPEQLGDRLRELLAAQEEYTPVDAEFQLTAGEIACLREQQLQVTAIGQQLAQSPIPLSLDHGDFWSAQILPNSRGYVFIDWSDANLTMPFFSLFKYLIPQEIEAVFPDNPSVESTLRDAYLDPWKRFATNDELLTLYHLTQAIAPLHYAIFNDRFLLPKMEVNWEQANMIPYFLKRLVSAMK